MNKRGVLPVLVTFFMISGTAYAGFDKNPTSALEDRRATAEANKEQTKLLKDLLAETKKTNDLLKGLIDVYTGSNRRQSSQGRGAQDSAESGDMYDGGSTQEPTSDRRNRRR